MNFFCLNRLRWLCQFWRRWRVCVAVIILSQSILLLLFTDIIQKKSPRISSADQASINTPFMRNGEIGEIGNASIRGDWLPRLRSDTASGVDSDISDAGAVRGGAGVLLMHNLNDTPLLRFNIPKRKSALKYEVPEAKLKNVKLAKLKQTLEVLSKKAEKSIIDGEMLQQQKQQQAAATYGKGWEVEGPLRDVISPMQSLDGEVRDDKNANNSNINIIISSSSISSINRDNNRNYVTLGDREKIAIDGPGNYYRDAGFVVDKVRLDQYNKADNNDRWSKIRDVNQGVSQEVSNKASDHLAKQATDQRSHVIWKNSQATPGKMLHKSTPKSPPKSLDEAEGDKLATVLTRDAGLDDKTREGRSDKNSVKPSGKGGDKSSDTNPSTFTDKMQQSVKKDWSLTNNPNGMVTRSRKGPVNFLSNGNSNGISDGVNRLSTVTIDGAKSDHKQNLKVKDNQVSSIVKDPNTIEASSVKGLDRNLNAANGLNELTILGFKSLSQSSAFGGPAGSNSVVTAARMNANKDKLTAGPPGESTDKKLVNGFKHSFKHTINSPIGLGRTAAATTKAPIYHRTLSNLVAANISRLAWKNTTDIMSNITLTEALVYEHPPRNSVPNYFHFKDEESTAPYFKAMGSMHCFIEGTDESFPYTNKSKHCHCKTGFYGQQCSIPDFVYFTAGSRYVQTITPRNKTRRIINALTYNMEHELLEARINDLFDVVDVFLILESNFSYHGDVKPLHLWESMRNGYLKKFQSKILYFFLDNFPEKGREDGWLADRYPRQYIGQYGLRHILGTRPDDLFIYTDTDEIPSRDALLFLRLHDGYPEPFGLTLRWSVYGFFWQQFEPTRVWVGCTLAMLRLVFNWEVYSLRSGNYWNQNQASVATYVRAGGLVYDWHLGGTAAADGSLVYTGWHCSWCLPPDRIRTKLTSAINADFPRWGDFPEKLDLEYIRGLIRTGTWFDDTTKIGDLTNIDDDDFFAPDYFLDNYNKFKALLDLNEAVKV